jgi:glycosyltransferase involved in cell wall biosynthesis
VRRVLIAFEPPDGGVAEHVAQLAASLGGHGWEVELAGPERTGVYERLAEAGLRVHRVPFQRGYGHPATDAVALRRLAGILRRGRFDLVHCHSAKAGVLGRLAARAAGVPAVYSPHCFPFVGDFGAPRRRFATLVERSLAPLSAAVICVSEDERREGLAAGLPAGRLTVVRNGCPPPPRVEPDPALEALRAGGPLAAAIAVMRPQKSLDVFVDAAPLVLERMPEARLALVGEGPLHAELAERARGHGLEDDPRFAILPFRAPAARHLRAADVFVLPSAWEGLPIAILEALSCGVPQVATAVGGTPEAVGDGTTGLLVPPRDPPALAAAIVALLGDPGRRGAMGRASVQRWQDGFQLERMVRETADVYARACNLN